MRQAQKHHVELRESYLNGLAEAIVLEKKTTFIKERELGRPLLPNRRTGPASTQM